MFFDGAIGSIIKPIVSPIKWYHAILWWPRYNAGTIFYNGKLFVNRYEVRDT